MCLNISSKCIYQINKYNSKFRKYILMLCCYDTLFLCTTYLWKPAFLKISCFLKSFWYWNMIVFINIVLAFSNYELFHLLGSFFNSTSCSVRHFSLSCICCEFPLHFFSQLLWFSYLQIFCANCFLFPLSVYVWLSMYVSHIQIHFHFFSLQPDL